MDGARVLVADADVVLAEAIAHSLRRQGYHVALARTFPDALRALEQSHFDVLVAEAELALVKGADLLASAQALTEAPLCFLLADRGDVRAAVDAMQRGATDYLEKPVDIATLILRIERALATATMRRRLAAIAGRERRAASPVAVSTQMQLALRLADRVAATPSSSALILGESGVGKEVIASRIHERSKRRSGPFVRVNLAALPETMVEAELFGSVRGAYTDSKRDRIGLFASADRGTIMLDELCEFKVTLQSKLLRVLESRSFFPVGSDRERPLNARVIAATNRDPRLAIEAGELRADLFYRLAPIIIRLAPLRERPSDILPLAERFIASSCAEFGTPVRRLSPDAQQALLEHDWPGNARELRNAIERAIMLGEESEVTADDLGIARRARGTTARPSAPASDDPSSSTGRPPIGSGIRPKFALPDAALTLEDAKQAALEEVERSYIERVLEQCGGSKTKAARILGVSRTTLWEKVKRYGMK